MSDITKADLSDLAWRVINAQTNAGKQIPIAAAPYLRAMRQLTTLDEMYGYDSAERIVLGFLSNAQHMRGDAIKAVKDELNRRLKERGAR
jgi:hypothetical protein